MMENIFWVVKSTEGIDKYLLFNSKPNKIKWHSFLKDKDEELWVARHSHLPLSKESAEKFKDIQGEDMAKVSLIITEDENPDLFIQRYKECLFIANHLEPYWHLVKEDNKLKKIFRKHKWVRDTRVPHFHMISNKLFHNVTEETGVVKINVVRI